MNASALILLSMVACKKPSPPADPEFNDALVYTFRAFEDEPAVLAFAVRELEAQLYSDLDVDSDDALDRSVSPDALTEEDIADIEHPSRDPEAALAVAVARSSNNNMNDHVRVQMLKDQTPVEPSSPDKYDRIFLEGDDCFPDQSCEYLRTENPLIKDNFLMTIDYTLWKDFRWVDLGLPDPSELEEGEEAIAESSRWAIIARSWTTEPAVGESGNVTIYQSFTIEAWIPNDDGVLRMMSLWSEADLGFELDDDYIIGVTRDGIDEIFEAADEWIEEN